VIDAADRYERLTFVDAIRQLKARYCRLADVRRWAPFSKRFTPDASIKFYDTAGALASQAKGRPGIIEKLTLSVGSAQPIHHLFSGEIQVHSADQATAIWAWKTGSSGQPAAYRTTRACTASGITTKPIAA
jgi:hypothetical protein